MTKILIVEDSTERHVFFRRWFAGHDVTFVESAEQAIATLRTNRYNVAFLDHDLGAGAPGVAVAEFLAQLPAEARPAQIVIHSNNTLGAAAMVRALLQAGNVNVVRVPYVDLINLYGACLLGPPPSETP